MRDWIDLGVDEHDEASLPTPHPHDYMSADEIRDEERRHDEAREELIRDMVAESQAAEPAAWELLVIAHDVLADLWDPRQARGGLAARHQRALELLQDNLRAQYIDPYAPEMRRLADVITTTPTAARAA